MWLALAVLIIIVIVVVSMVWPRPSLRDNNPTSIGIIPPPDELDLEVCTSHDAKFETQGYQVIIDSEEVVQI